MRAARASLAVALLAWVGLLHAETAVPLPALNVDLNETSVSGLSSGGFMAVQFAVAHSGIVKGAGIVAAGPYWCAQGSAFTATTRCSCTLDPAHTMCQVSPTSADVPALVAATKRFARDGLIDDPAQLAHERVMLVAGGQDQTVPAAVVDQLQEYLVGMGVPTGQIKRATLAKAGHAMPTLTYGSACNVTGAPFINDCDFDAAREMLAWIYGPLQPSRQGAPQGRFIRFDQRPYKPGSFGFDWTSGLDSTGWVYVPDSCARGEACKVHVALHGCRQGQSYATASWSWNSTSYGTTFVEHAGYDAVADTNHLVVLYPQATSVWFFNPNGCWDWWGYTDSHYADRQGVQIRAIRAMLDRLAAGAR